MVTVSRVHNFVGDYILKFPRNFVAFNAENDLFETEKSLQKTDMGSSRSEDLPSDEIPNF